MQIQLALVAGELRRDEDVVPDGRDLTAAQRVDLGGRKRQLGIDRPIGIPGVTGRKQEPGRRRHVDTGVGLRIRPGEEPVDGRRSVGAGDARLADCRDPDAHRLRSRAVGTPDDGRGRGTAEESRPARRSAARALLREQRVRPVQAGLRVRPRLQIGLAHDGGVLARAGEAQRRSRDHGQRDHHPERHHQRNAIFTAGSAEPRRRTCPKRRSRWSLIGVLVCGYEHDFPRSYCWIDVSRTWLGRKARIEEGRLAGNDHGRPRVEYLDGDALDIAAGPPRAARLSDHDVREHGPRLAIRA